MCMDCILCVLCFACGVCVVCMVCVMCVWCVLRSLRFVCVLCVWRVSGVFSLFCDLFSAPLSFLSISFLGSYWDWKDTGIWDLGFRIWEGKLALKGQPEGYPFLGGTGIPPTLYPWDNNLATTTTTTTTTTITICG
ncbi:hypothetical protein BO82DRAFT_46731 [Aspergillus uvarum CBS 121591]|uniref:Uncharacterized protein n=1 Tax=Aspergillus uvarum CBS 121591 TaxID=1448315 RepID=A0A319CFD4_9EURO|nr:hypothetical protein BO82DRAFT_46731 [Aspergillus uvarum CBS 121591]PYH83150.1 hypothetical protein BO82DRAFT_46731 [Aspergillus uvarum CBS 121591]